jgi:hypothetical protein
MRSSSRVLLVLALASVALPASADWKRDYDRGTRAFEKQNWSEAEAAFRAALSEEPVPDARKRFQGVRTAVYVPHYYAGVAAWRQGACERAMQYWSNPASTAVVGGITKLDAEQERGVSDCRRKLASTAAPTPGATVATSSAPTSASTAPSTPAPAATTSGKPSATSTTTPASTTKPATPAQTPPAAAPPRTTPSAPAVAPTKPVAAPAQSTSSPAPAPLVAAVEQYLGGQYATLLQLDPARLSDGRSRAQAHLLRAAAHHATGVLEGSLDAQLDAIRREIRSARAANASLQPDAALFSPRFRALWQQTR